jgi:hypothetical protein
LYPLCTYYIVFAERSVDEGLWSEGVSFVRSCVRGCIFSLFLPSSKEKKEASETVNLLVFPSGCVRTVVRRLQSV